MSHSVSVKVALNTEGELIRIDEMNREIKTCAGIYQEKFKDEIVKIEAQIKKAREEIKAIGENTVVDNNKLLFDYQQRVDKIMKSIANIASSIDYGSVYESMNTQAVEKLNEIIVENGIMAMIAISEINDDHAELSPESLLAMIDKIRTEKLGKEEKDRVISKLENTIMEIDIPDESKATLLEQSDELSSPQEIMDLIAMLKSHELSFKRMKDSASKFEEALVSQGFTLNGRTNSVSAKGELELNINAYKEGTKDITIELNSSMGAQWQHGDYEHHMCKADAEGFLEELKKVGVDYSAPFVIRTHSNSRPLQRAAKLKEREM